MIVCKPNKVRRIGKEYLDAGLGLAICGYEPGAIYYFPAPFPSYLFLFRDRHERFTADYVAGKLRGDRS